MREEIRKTVFDGYAENPIMWRKVVDEFIKKAKSKNDLEALQFMERIKRELSLFDEKMLRVIKSDLFLKGGDPNHAEMLSLAFERLANNEITLNVFNAIREKINAPIKSSFEKSEYKFDVEALRKIGEQLSVYGFISKEDIGMFWQMHGAMKWKGPKSYLIYLIEQIRKDGKCSYSEYGKLFNIKLAANNRKHGHDEIDQIIKLATSVNSLKPV